MDENSLIEKIMMFGLGRQEAVIYLCLLGNGVLTGYEVSKITGISRSNVYNGLSLLVEHGAAYLMEGASKRYVPVALEEFCENRIRFLIETKEWLGANSPEGRPVVEGYLTLEGYCHILDKIHHMLQGAVHRIYFNASPEFLSIWGAELTGLAERGIKVVVIARELPEGLPADRITFYRRLDRAEDWEDREKQVRLIIDSALVLTGEVSGDVSDTCLYSAQRNLVNVFKEAMGNEIRLIELAADSN